MTPGPDYTEHRFESSDGLSLYYRSYGFSDKTLLCLPGLTRNCKDFEELAIRYASDWRVITPDLRGRGQSDRDPNASRYQHQTYVRDTWQLLDHLGIQNFVVLGTSLGGWIAMLMASQQAERLRGLVLNDIGPVVPDEAVQRLMTYVGLIPPAPDWTTAADQVRQVYQVAFPNVTDSFWPAYARLSMLESGDGFIVPDMDPSIGSTFRKTYRKIKTVNRLARFGLFKNAATLIKNGYWDQFKTMSVPCLLLRGAVSDVLTEDIVEKMKVAQPEMKTVTVADRGHVPMLNESEAIISIDQFLDSVVIAT